MPDENPSSLGVFKFSLRHPGQYDDPETGLFYNYLRDCYDSATGRYCQGDPIGLAGGINTYTYVAASPLSYIDASGLYMTSVQAACLQMPELCAEVIGQIVQNTSILTQGCVTDEAAAAADAIRDLGAASSNVLMAVGLGGVKIASNVAKGARGVTDFVTNATVISRGKVIGRGTVDVRPTVQAIQSGRLAPKDIFQNRAVLLPRRPMGHYEEFVLPTPGVTGAGPQRIVRGQSGELYYTPDHYKSFVPLN